MATRSMQELNTEEHVVLIAVGANVHRGRRPDDQAFARGAQLGSISDLRLSFSGPTTCRSNHRGSVPRGFCTRRRERSLEVWLSRHDPRADLGHAGGIKFPI